MNTELITFLITTVFSAITGVCTWWVSRKGKKAELKEKEAELESRYIANVRGAIEIWQDTARGLQEQIQELQNDISGLKEENQLLMKMLEQARKENYELKVHISSLERKLERYNNTTK